MTSRSLVHFFKANNQIVLILMAILCGFTVPNAFRWLTPYTTPMLMVVFFTSSLRLSFETIVTYAKDWRMLVLGAGFKLIVLPLALFVPFSLIDREWGLALLIFGAMPIGMSIALVAEFLGGISALALLMTTAVSLVAPFVIPLVINIAIGTSVDLPVVSMFLSLVQTIVLPFAVAMLIRRFARKNIINHDTAIQRTSLGFLIVLIATLIAASASTSIANIAGRDFVILLLAMGWLLTLVAVSYRLTPWRTPKERVTVALCILYNNYTLALYIANKFFPESQAIPKLVLLLLSVNFLLPLFKWEAHRVLKHAK
ncbi:MAG: bile acid:sodium symporter [Patescibacteria group bacterium]